MRAFARARSQSVLSVSAAWLVRAASVACLALLWGCNSITGAGELRLVDRDELEDDDDNNSSGNGGAAPTGGGGVGVGGAGGTPTACTYPTENIGESVGQVAPGSFKWSGYAEGTTMATEISEISIDSYHDCDGSKGINALLILTSATWCGVCDGEAQMLNEYMDGGWKDMGIRVLTLMIEDATSKPATTQTAFAWKNAANHKLVSTAVAADPGFSFAPSMGGSIGLPYTLVIDPRTMQFVQIQQGSSGGYPELESLAQKNAQPTP